MSLIAQVTAATGATRADVIRVATHGGTTQADWDIAYAIEAAGGRSACELMFAAGREQEISAIWADSRDDQTETAPANPHAVYDEVVTVYPENTSPDETREVIPHHPGDTTEAPTEQDALQIQVWAAVANLLTPAPREVIDRIVAPWTSIDEIRNGLVNLLRVLTSARCPRARRMLRTYVTAA